MEALLDELILYELEPTAHWMGMGFQAFIVLNVASPRNLACFQNSMTVDGVLCFGILGREPYGQAAGAAVMPSACRPRSISNAAEQNVAQ